MELQESWANDFMTTVIKDSDIRKPGFFLAGAPKCGTTAFYLYLRAHPNIFLPKREDMHFFAKDFSVKWDQVGTFEEYLAYFRNVKREHKAVGERSVYYLFSKIALESVYAFNKDARIMIFLRSPIDHVCSFHSQMLFMLNENVADLEEAWHLQEVRLRGEHIPPTCADPQVLQYRGMASFGEQLQRALDIFPRDQVKVVLLEDFIEAPLLVYKELLRFLDLPYDGRTEFPKKNVRKRLRSKFLARLVLRQPPFIKAIMSGFKKLFGLEQTGLGVALMKMNTKHTEQLQLSPQFRRELVEAFRDDVMLLSNLLGRDLTHWLV
jgi:hypothetical protein